MHIKNRLAIARAGKPDDTPDINMFKAWEEDIRQTATKDARLAVKQELDTHESVVGQYKAQAQAAEAQRDSAVTKQTAVETITGEKIAALEKSLAVVKSNWDATKEALKAAALVRNTKASNLVDEQLKTQQLMIQLAEIQGELAASRRPAAVVSPTVIPEFEFTPTRDMEGYATKWTAKPKGLN